jgi:hypothetical protein
MAHGFAQRKRAPCSDEVLDHARDDTGSNG